MQVSCKGVWNPYTSDPASKCDDMNIFVYDKINHDYPTVSLVLEQVTEVSECYYPLLCGVRTEQYFFKWGVLKYCYTINWSELYIYHEVKISFHPLLWVKVKENCTCFLINKKWWFLDIFQSFSESLLNPSNLIVANFCILSNVWVYCLEPIDMTITTMENLSFVFCIRSCCLSFVFCIRFCCSSVYSLI
jgi:hypothetical protein